MLAIRAYGTFVTQVSIATRLTAVAASSRLSSGYPRSVAGGAAPA
jgi:hypothetical protein